MGCWLGLGVACCITLWGAAYTLSQLIHKHVGALAFGIYFLLMPKSLRPTSFAGIPRPKNEITVELCWPYYQFWRLALTTKDRKSLAPKPVGCPILFLYGSDKNVMFHNSTFLRDIDSRTDGRSRHLAIEGGGHWLVSAPGAVSAQCLEAVDAFLELGQQPSLGGIPLARQLS